jgi:hypothetical protein
MPPRTPPGTTIPGALAHVAAGAQIEQAADATRINTAYLPTHMPITRGAPAANPTPTNFSSTTSMPTARTTPVPGAGITARQGEQAQPAPRHDRAGAAGATHGANGRRSEAERGGGAGGGARRGAVGPALATAPSQPPQGGTALKADAVRRVASGGDAAAATRTAARGVPPTRGRSAQCDCRWADEGASHGHALGRAAGGVVLRSPPHWILRRRDSRPRGAVGLGFIERRRGAPPVATAAVIIETATVSVRRQAHRRRHRHAADLRSDARRRARAHTERSTMQEGGAAAIARLHAVGKPVLSKSSTIWATGRVAWDGVRGGSVARRQTGSPTYEHPRPGRAS